MDRKSQYAVNPLFLKRWSPRAMSGEMLTDEELMTVLEAARWAPSSYNVQPWRFLYAKKGSADWDKFFGLMVEFNQSWAKNASALVVMVSKKTSDNNTDPFPTHSFDAGSAWENLALQAADMGLVAHAMAGFDYAKAKTELNVSDDFAVEAMVALGKPGKKEELPEGMAEREEPSDRKPLSEIVMEGGFKK